MKPRIDINCDLGESHCVIQVPKNGKPIRIMRDAQTTGGYPKIAATIIPDVSLLGQAKPDDIIEFHKIMMGQTCEKLFEYYKLLNNLRWDAIKEIKAITVAQH